tara:strand:- start:21 stop:185 length:165 start_codon:yes stop_codon:yes gene_type:complete
MVIKYVGDSPLLALTAFMIGTTKPMIPKKMSIKIPSPTNRIAGMLTMVNNIKLI